MDIKIVIRSVKLLYKSGDLIQSENLLRALIDYKRSYNEAFSIPEDENKRSTANELFQALNEDGKDDNEDFTVEFHKCCITIINEHLGLKL